MPARCSVRDHRLELLHLLAARAEARRSRCAGRRSRWCCSPSSCDRPLSTSVESCTNWCTGISSTAVTPSCWKWSIIAGCARPGVGAAHVRRDVRVAHRHALDVRLVDHRLVVGDAQRPVVGPVEERVDHHRASWRTGAESASLNERRVAEPVGEQRLVPRRCARRSPWRTGRAAAWPGCSAARPPGRTGRAPGSRSAARARPGAGSRARPARRARAGRPASPCRRRRTGTARSARRPRRRSRSWCRRRRRTAPSG